MTQPSKLSPIPLASPKREEGEFVVFEAVAFFKEHTNRDGVRIDRAALERICNRCNERIRDTGDFPPVVLRHTTDERDRDPEVVGFAGPFYLGSVGNLRPKAAIFGTMWIFAEDAARVKKYPRLSVEYWASEDDPANGYFDPVSLLGAETPELDLGIHYSRGRKGKRPLRYARIERFAAKRVAAVSTEKDDDASAGDERLSAPNDATTVDEPASPAVPATLEAEQNTHSSQETSNMALRDEDIQRLVAAMKPMIQTMVDEALESQVDAEGEEANVEEGEDNYATNDAAANDDASETIDSEDEGIDDSAADLELQNEDPDTDNVADTVADDDAEADDAKAEDVARDQLQAECASLRAEMNGAHAEKRRAVRHQKLADLQTQGCAVDLDDEVAECDSLDDVAFEKHCERVATKYQRVPFGYVKQLRPEKQEGHSVAAKRARYVKQASDNVLQARERGIQIDFKDELDRLVAQNFPTS